MSLFRRRAAAPSPVSDADLVDSDQADTASAERDEGASDPVAGARSDSKPSPRPGGPFDSTEVDGPGERLDLGSVWLAPVPGLEVRIVVDQQADRITGLQLHLDDSAAQVQAFAAPRSGGLWSEIRDELAASIGAAGGSVEEAEGAFGAELIVQLPQPGPDGETVLAPARFLGIDGPRWFLRVVVSGRAVAGPEADGPILDAVRGLVVVRGATPMAPRELLPLHLPEQGEAGAPAEEEPEARQPDLNPFERGPEITEVR